MKLERYESVWDALEPSPAGAANMKARAELMTALREVIDGWRATQTDAAGRLQITQPRLNDLLRGRINKFSLDALVELAERAGLSVEMRIRRHSVAALRGVPPKPRKAATLAGIEEEIARDTTRKRMPSLSGVGSTRRR
ncbi:MAG TPA: helix-turn-helix transcriptional regulator [Rhizomicrobium sp.]|nr:helix-turn-helix transcriptional regulator [Rhizomicrobium sp.]